MTNKDKKILIIEDEQPLRKSLVDNLSLEGYTVLEARDGVEGLRGAEEGKPDLILLDILMPKMDGLTMLKKLRASGPYGKAVPVILLTNLNADTDQIVSDIAETEPAFYLVKADWTIQQVIDTVRDRLKEKV